MRSVTPSCSKRVCRPCQMRPPPPLQLSRTPLPASQAQQTSLLPVTWLAHHRRHQHHRCNLSCRQSCESTAAAAMPPDMQPCSPSERCVSKRMNHLCGNQPLTPPAPSAPLKHGIVSARPRQRLRLRCRAACLRQQWQPRQKHRQSRQQRCRKRMDRQQFQRRSMSRCRISLEWWALRHGQRCNV